MRLIIGYILTAVAIGLLVIYGADVAVTYSSDSEKGFLPLNEMQRGIGLGGPALILPIIAFVITLKAKSIPLAIMIISSGILIIIGGLAVILNPSPESVESGKNPISSSIMLFAPGIIQIVLGGIKVKKSA